MDGDVPALIDEVLQRCTSCLQDATLVQWRQRVDEMGLSRQPPFELALAEQTAGDSAIAKESEDRNSDSTYERFLLLTCAAAHLPLLAGAPLPTSVKKRICQQVQVICDAQDFAQWRLGSPAFGRLLHIAALRRFPAGLFEWEVSGISRSDCLRTPVTAWPTLVAFVMLKMRGLKPVFFSHLARVGTALDEIEANRSYYRMAMAMARQPDVLGFAACSWFRAPSTHRVSPHLAWLSNVFREHGGLVVDAGPDPEKGSLYRSPTRRALYESGLWTPKRGLVMWPRAAMLEWAASRPDLAE